MASHFAVAAPVLGLSLLASSAAFAGGLGCTNCYRPVVRPAVLGEAPVPVLVRPEMWVSRIIHARYATVKQPVILPARRVWRVTRDASGRVVGCWVTVPARTAYVHTKTLVAQRSSGMPSGHYPAVFGSRDQLVTLEPGGVDWTPIQSVVASY